MKEIRSFQTSGIIYLQKTLNIPEELIFRQKLDESVGSHVKHKMRVVFHVSSEFTSPISINTPKPSVCSVYYRF
jgi:hypothetical protein